MWILCHFWLQQPKISSLVRYILQTISDLTGPSNLIVQQRNVININKLALLLAIGSRMKITTSACGKAVYNFSTSQKAVCLSQLCRWLRIGIPCTEQSLDFVSDHPLVWYWSGPVQNDPRNIFDPEFSSLYVVYSITITTFEITTMQLRMCILGLLSWWDELILSWLLMLGTERGFAVIIIYVTMSTWSNWHGYIRTWQQ